MDKELTIGVLIVTIFMVTFANYRSRKPRKMGRAWQVPWNAVQFVGVLMLFLTARHLLGFYGAE